MDNPISLPMHLLARWFKLTHRDMGRGRAISDQKFQRKISSGRPNSCSESQLIDAQISRR